MAKQQIENRGPYSSSPGGFSITPNDSVDLTRPVRAVYIGVSGDLVVDTLNGDTLTFVSVPVGIFPVQVKRVYATNTTADSLIGLD